MSEEFPLSDLQSVPHTGSAGGLLRQAREASGLHIAALAVAMKVPVKKLEALEADRLDLLPDAVFVRALASSMCRALKIDSTPVLQLLPQTSVPRLDAEERGINEPFQSGSHASATTVPELLVKPVVWLVLILLVGAILLFALPRIPGLDRESDSPQQVVTPPVEALVPEAQNPVLLASAPVAVASEPIAHAAQPASAPAVVASAAVPLPPPAAKPAVSAPAPTVAAVAPAAAASKPLVTVPANATQTVDLAGSTNGTVVFKARGTSWVEVTDAKGVVQLRKTLFNGETSGASGALPLSVVVGRADVTNVEVRGKAFALDAIARDNVARFEVK